MSTRHIILAIVATIIATISINAQTAAPLQYKCGNLYQNGVKLTSSQALQVLGEDLYDHQYKPAKGLRTSGIVLVSTGAAAVAAGGGMFIYALASNNTADSILALPATIITATGAGIAVVGGILWGVGNGKMKKIVPAASGVGLAFNF